MKASEALKKISVAAEGVAAKVKSLFEHVAKEAKASKSGNATFTIIEETFERIVTEFVEKLAEIEGGSVEDLAVIRSYADRVRATVDSVYGLIGRWQGVPFGGSKFEKAVEAVKLAVDELDDLIDSIDDAVEAAPASAPKKEKKAPKVAKAETRTKAKSKGPAVA